MQDRWLGMERMLRAVPSTALLPLKIKENASGSVKMVFLQESSLSSGSFPPSLTKASPVSQNRLCIRSSALPSPLMMGQRGRTITLLNKKLRPKQREHSSHGHHGSRRNSIMWGQWCLVQRGRGATHSGSCSEVTSSAE